MHGSTILMRMSLGRVIDAHGVERRAYLFTARHTEQSIPDGARIIGMMTKKYMRRLDGGDAHGVFVPCEIQTDLVKMGRHVSHDMEFADYRAGWARVVIGGPEQGWPEEMVAITAFRREPEAVIEAWKAGLRPAFGANSWTELAKAQNWAAARGETLSA